MTTIQAKAKIMNTSQMQLKVDVAGLEALKHKVVSDFDKLNAEFNQKVNELYDIEGFNINSSAKKKLLLECLGIDTSRGANKQVFESYIDTYPILKEMGSLSEIEHLRRCLCGSKKNPEENIFNDFQKQADGSYIFKPEFVMTEGRLYENKLYAMPYPMREHLYPTVGEKFYYFDLHAAELTLAAHMSGDQQLLEDCLTENVWNYWYSVLGIDKSLKMELKRAIYSCIYSMSDVSIPAKIGKKFFELFFTRYPVLFDFLKKRKSEGLRNHRNLTWDNQPCFYKAGEYHEDYKILNHPIQFGISGYVMQIAAYLMDFMYVSAINFDSVWVCGIDSIDQLKAKVDEAMENIGMKFRYSTSEGSNFAQAQGK